MSLLLSQIGAPPAPQPRLWTYSRVHTALYEEGDDPIRVLGTGWLHVTPAVAPSTHGQAFFVKQYEDFDTPTPVLATGWLHVTPAIAPSTHGPAFLVKPVDDALDETWRPWVQPVWSRKPQRRTGPSQSIRQIESEDEWARIQWIGGRTGDAGIAGVRIVRSSMVSSAVFDEAGPEHARPIVQHISTNLGTFHLIIVRGNAADGSDDYMESWFS